MISCRLHRLNMLCLQLTSLFSLPFLLTACTTDPAKDKELKTPKEDYTTGYFTKYSRSFHVLSRFSKEVVIHNWEGFDAWCPAQGNIIPNAAKKSQFPMAKDFSNSTVVVWTVEGESQQKRQEIDLRGVVPRNVEGHTHFDLSAEGVWSVRFVPGETGY